MNLLSVGDFEGDIGRLRIFLSEIVFRKLRLWFVYIFVWNSIEYFCIEWYMIYFYIRVYLLLFFI